MNVRVSLSCAAGFMLLMAMINASVVQAQAPDKDSITNLIKQLGAATFEKREDASQKLWLTGREAEPVIVQQLREVTNPEIRLRCRRVLDKFRLGIYPDTPPDVVAMLNDFSKGDLETKSQIIRRLRGKKEYLESIRLVDTLQNKDDQLRLSGELVDSITKLIPAVIANNSLDVADELLSWTAKYDQTGKTARDYAVFLILRQKFTENNQQPKDEDRVAANHLVRANIHSLNKDYEQALETVEKASPGVAKEKLIDDILLRSRDWKRLADRVEESDLKGLAKDGFLAAYRQLAGEEKEWQAKIGAIRQIAIQSPDQVPQCTIAFLISHSLDHAIEFNRLHDPPEAFSLLCYQSRYDDAFKMIQLDDPHQGAAKWFRSKSQTEKVTNAKRRETEKTFILANRLAQQLSALGENEQARLLLLEIAKETALGDDTRSSMLIKTCLAAGARSTALDIANARLENLTRHERRMNIIKNFIPNRAGLASDVLEAIRPQDDSLEEEDPELPGLVQRVTKIVNPKSGETLSLHELKPHIARIEAHFIKLDTKRRVRSIVYRNVGELCRIHDQNPLAIEYFKKSNANNANAEVLLRIGDCFAADEDWRSAATFYGESAQEAYVPESIGFVAVAMFLEGKSLIKAGDQQEGARRISIAELLPLASPEARHEFANSLGQRGYHAESKRHFLMGCELAMADLDSYSFHRLTQRCADVLRIDHPSNSANWRQLSLLHMLSGQSHFNEIESYLAQADHIHMERAGAYEKNDKTQLAIEELKMCEAIGNNGSEATVRLVEALRGLGEDDAAESAMSKALKRFQSVTDRFENAATHHNAAAWLLAKCDGDLVQALSHAEQATMLNPNSAAFADTLAEVHFQTGDFDKALKASELAAELEPDSAEFKKRLEFFQKSAQ